MPFTVIDDREVLVWLVTDPSPNITARDDDARRTNGTHLVNKHRVLDDLLCTRARDAPRPKT